MNSFFNYLRDVRAEMTHVSWPSQAQALGSTALVIGISLVVAVLLGIADFVFTLGLEQFLAL